MFRLVPDVVYSLSQEASPAMLAAKGMILVYPSYSLHTPPVELIVHARQLAFSEHFTAQTFQSALLVTSSPVVPSNDVPMEGHSRPPEDILLTEKVTIKCYYLSL